MKAKGQKGLFSSGALSEDYHRVPQDHMGGTVRIETVTRVIRQRKSLD